MNKKRVTVCCLLKYILKILSPIYYFYVLINYCPNNWHKSNGGSQASHQIDNYVSNFAKKSDFPWG